jgi:hypothetical protein
MKPYHTLIRLGSLMLLALPAALTANADYQSTVLSQAPVGYYRLNETVQPLANGGATNTGSLGASADGAFVSYPVLNAPGPFPGAVGIGFDGTASYVNTPHSSALNTTNFTFEAWLKPDQAPKFAYPASSVDFASPRSGWYLAQDDGSVFGAGSAWVVRIFNLNGSSFGGQVDAPIASAGVWVHLVVTYDDTTKLLSMYTNGVIAEQVTALPGANGLAYVPNQNGGGNDPFTVGARNTANFFWPGTAAQTAMYGTALSSNRVAAHYAAATDLATYKAAVFADAPLLYHDYQAPPSSPAANLGTLGSAGDGLFLPNSIAAAPGPVPPVYPGFDPTNTAAAFIADGGAVRLPAFNLNTNTVTISTWVNVTNLQLAGAGIVVNTAGSGLIMDGVEGGLGLGYYWASTAGTFNWRPTVDAVPPLPPLPDSEWAFAALVIRPTEANIYIGTTNGGTITFASATNFFSHVNSFSAATLVGSDLGDPAYSLNGAVDEVAIFNRSLSGGELYTQFASAVDGVAPTIFSSLVGPAGPAALGDSFSLSVDAGGAPPLVYTWSKDATPIAATTNSGTLTIATATFGDAGTYTVVVTNSFGTATTNSVVVTVVPPTQPVILGQEGFFTNRVLYPTGTLHLAVSATGGGLKYQWFKGAAAIAGATASSYRVASVTAANAGSYTVVVTNTVGAVTNGPATIIVPTVVSNTYEAAIIASGPEAWWRFDESPGSTIMFDGVGRHDGFYTNLLGSNTLPTLGVTGALVGNTNRAISFDLSGAVGVAPYSPQLNSGQMTVELWVKTANLTQLGIPVSCADSNAGGWSWLANAGVWNGYSPFDNQRAPLEDNEYPAAIAPNIWTHLVISYDNTVIISGSPYPYRYWINGSNPGFVWQGDPLSNIAPYIFGGCDPAVRAARFFEGSVDEVAMYRRLITATEITNHIVARGIELIVPVFTSQPLPQTVTAGKTVSFSAAAVGSPTTIAYQWFKNATPITAATNNSLTLINVGGADTGGYSLRATNLAGATFSTTANLTVIASSGYANITNDLVLHLRFEDDASDSSGRGNNGTLSSAPAPVFETGLIGAKAAKFTTTTLNETNFVDASYAVLGTPADLLFGAGQSFSVSLWVQLTNGAAFGDLPFIGTETNGANNPGWFVGPSFDAGGWQWNLNDGNLNRGAQGADNSINDGNWHNVIVSVDRAGAVVKGYLDGVLITSTSIAGLGSIDVGGPITIGQDPALQYAEGGVMTLDDIGIWRRALTPLEAAQIASAGSSGRSFDSGTPPAVALTITPSGANLILGYANGTLEQSPTVGPGAVWTPVSGANPPSFTITPTNAANFYRVWVN